MVPCSLGGKVKSSKKISAIFGFSIVENLVYTPISKSESTLPYKRSIRAAVVQKILHSPLFNQGPQQLVKNLYHLIHIINKLIQICKPHIRIAIMKITAH